MHMLWHGLTRGDLLALTVSTMERMIYGWMLASLGGVLFGALVGVSPRARYWLMPTLELMRPLPASTLLPVGIALFGLKPGMLLGIIAFGAVWPVLLPTIHGFSTIDPRLREVARNLDIGPLAFAIKFGLPNALPDVIAGDLAAAFVYDMTACRSTGCAWGTPGGLPEPRHILTGAFFETLNEAGYPADIELV